jgi:hypothetical protein
MQPLGHHLIAWEGYTHMSRGERMRTVAKLKCTHRRLLDFPSALNSGISFLSALRRCSPRWTSASYLRL